MHAKCCVCHREAILDPQSSSMLDRRSSPHTNCKFWHIHFEWEERERTKLWGKVLHTAIVLVPWHEIELSWHAFMQQLHMMMIVEDRPEIWDWDWDWDSLLGLICYARARCTAIKILLNICLSLPLSLSLSPWSWANITHRNMFKHNLRAEIFSLL